MKNKIIIIPAFFLTAILITLLLPANHLSKYSHNLGQTWNKADLYAPYDFPILKSEQEYEKNLIDAENRYTPIYSFNNDISSKMLYQLNETVLLTIQNQSIDSIEIAKINNFKQTIKQIFNNGIIGTDKKDDNLIRLSKNGEITNTTLEKFYLVNEVLPLLRRQLDSITTLDKLEIEDYIIPNINLNEQLNQAELKAIKSEIPRSKGFVTKSSLLVKKGEIISSDIEEKLSSLESETENKGVNQNSVIIIAGNFLYVLILLGLSFTFLFFFRKDFSKKTGNVLFVLFIYSVMALFSFGVSKFSSLNIYLIPFAIVPFYIVTFYDIRMSIFEYTLVLILCAPFSQEPMNFFYINLAAGLAGIFALQNSYHRRKIFFAVGIILLVYILSFIAISFTENMSFKTIKWSELIWFVLNIVLFLGFYQLIYIFEKIFGFVTDITLFELCDTNNDLLKKLSENAAGTFQHSMQVANLAEAAAKEIGANPLYARTGALYHDIGKLENPLYFIENNLSSVNPHDKLAPLESTEIIKSHVSDGLKLARKYNLPTVIDDFITMHHGKSLIYYFYHKYKEENPETTVDENLFRYDGSNPITKEVTICMMADSVEAASRTLKDYSKEEISTLVDNIVDRQMVEGNFVNSLLSFADITKVKEVFKSKIEGIYHKRVEYPKR